MVIHFILAALVLMLSINNQAHAGKIIGGHNTAAHSRPYMVFVKGLHGNITTAHCGGFLVSEDFVITAAHCKAQTYNICLGMENYKSKDKLCFSVKQDFPHKKYDEKTYSNDIMLLKLATRAIFNNNVKPIPLADISDDSLPKACLVSGWGKTSKNNLYLSPKLMEVNVTLTFNELCTKENVYCSKGEKGPAEGDSGGPLVCEHGKAYGVISAKNHVNHLHKYTKIPDNREWIEKIMKLH